MRKNAVREIPEEEEPEGTLQADAGTVAAPKKRLTVFGVEYVYLAFMGILIAFCGWVAENLVRLVTHGVIDSRFHLFPFIPVYALISFAAQIVVGDPDDLCLFGKKIFKKKNRKNRVLSNILCLCFLYAAVFLGELVVGNGWEMIAGVQLWDYSELPLHVTQYAGVLPMIGYGTGAWLLIKFILRPGIRALQTKANYNVVRVIVIICSILFIVDDALMFTQILVAGEAPVYWQIVVWQ